MHKHLFKRTNHSFTSHRAPCSYRRISLLRIFVTIFLFFVGLLTPSFIRNVASRIQSEVTQLERIQSLQDNIQELREENIRLKERYQLLSNEKISMGEEVLHERGLFSFTDSLNYARERAGFVSVEGRGFVISLEDSKATETNQNSIIHAQDIIYLINLINACGARGTAVNDQRVVSTSGIVCNGPKIRINDARYPVPFTISGVCEDPESVIEVLQEDSYIKSRVSDGVSIRYAVEDFIALPAFNDMNRPDALYSLTEGRFE